MRKKLYGYLCLGTLIFLLDRITKMAALAWCSESAYVVNNFLSFQLFFNRGVSWGMFHSDSSFIFAAVSLVIAFITVWLSWHAYKNYKHGYSIIGETCIIAGSLSNIVDRALYHGVIDFIILSYQDFSWPVFNVADAVIVLGVAILIFYSEK